MRAIKLIRHFLLGDIDFPANAIRGSKFLKTQRDRDHDDDTAAAVFIPSSLVTCNRRMRPY